MAHYVHIFILYIYIYLAHYVHIFIIITKYQHTNSFVHAESPVFCRLFSLCVVYYS